MNNTYKLEFKSPLVRPGITISTEVSEKYLKEAIENTMDIISKVNATKTKWEYRPASPKDVVDPSEWYRP